MTTYTVQVQASNEQGTIWQALAPAENFTTDPGETNWTAEDVARWTANNQNIADGPNWRVCVWDGADADTGTGAAFVLDAGRQTSSPTDRRHNKTLPNTTSSPRKESHTMTTLQDLATEMAAKYGDTRDQALTVVTTYAADLGYEVFAGGQAPGVEVSDQDAEHIVRAYEAGWGKPQD